MPTQQFEIAGRWIEADIVVFYQFELRTVGFVGSESIDKNPLVQIYGVAIDTDIALFANLNLWFSNDA